MAYTVLNAADIVAGKPTKEELFTQIRTNQEAFNSSITLLQGTSKIDIIDFKYGGYINDYSQAELDEASPVFAAPVNGTFVEFKVILLEASTSGTLTVDLQKSTDNGATWNTIMSAKPSITATTVASVSSTPTWSNDAFNQGELFRIIVDSVQVGQGSFHVSIYGELS